MSSLVLEFRPGEMLIVNGASIRFRSRTRIEVTAHVRFVFGKQVMLPEAAHTPARQFYLALQTAYAGKTEERAAALITARLLGAALKDRSTSSLISDALDSALAAAEACDGFAALNWARRIIEHEEAESDRERLKTEAANSTQAGQLAS